jgi:hypothetical protein
VLGRGMLVSGLAAGGELSCDGVAGPVSVEPWAQGEEDALRNGFLVRSASHRASVSKSAGESNMLDRVLVPPLLRTVRSCATCDSFVGL